jgi:predicted small secreted protein
MSEYFLNKFAEAELNGVSQEKVADFLADVENEGYDAEEFLFELGLEKAAEYLDELDEMLYKEAVENGADKPSVWDRYKTKSKNEYEGAKNWVKGKGQWMKDNPNKTILGAGAGAAAGYGLYKYLKKRKQGKHASDKPSVWDRYKTKSKNEYEGAKNWVKGKGQWMKDNPNKTILGAGAGAAAGYGLYKYLKKKKQGKHASDKPSVWDRYKTKSKNEYEGAKNWVKGKGQWMKDNPNKTILGAGAGAAAGYGLYKYLKKKKQGKHASYAEDLVQLAKEKLYGE